MFVFPVLVKAQMPDDPQKALQAIVLQEQKAAEAFLKNDLKSAASNNFDIYYLRCEWQVDPAVKFISGTITSYFTMPGTGNSITFDCANQLIVDSVYYHNAKISFQQNAGNILDITFPSNIAAGSKDSVSVFYHGIPPGTGLGSFYQGTHAGVPVIWTLSEPYGGKDWWPCKNGQQDKSDSIDIYITHPSAYVASSNGIMVDQQIIGGNTITHFKHGYPIASYLIAMAVTNYVVYKDSAISDGITVPLVSYGYPERAATFIGIEPLTKRAFTTYSKWFGRYPFYKEKYGHTQWGWNGGMEHQTNTFIIGENRDLVSHELGHQWFGNKVTCGSWADIWLNEGFATYSTALMVQDQYPLASYRSFLRQTLNSATAGPAGSVYVTDTTDVNRIFSGRLSYNKAAYVIHMLRWVIGDSAFKQGLQNYLNDPQLAYGTAKTADMQRHMEAASGKNLSVFFQKWIYGQGYPNYNAVWYQNSNNWANVQLNQTTTHQSVPFFDMPVELTFRNATEIKSFVVDHKFNGQKFWLNVGFVADTVVVDSSMWLLAKTKTSKKIAPSTLNPDDVIIYPNPSPSNGNVVVRNPTGSNLSVQLFNSMGQIVFSTQVQTFGGDEFITLPFARYARGVYWVRVRNDKDMNIVKKILH